MAKVFGMHMIGLRPGVKGEDFETFFREKSFVAWRMSRRTGIRSQIVKRDS